MVHEITRPPRSRIGSINDRAGDHGIAFFVRCHSRGEATRRKLDMGSRKRDMITAGNFQTFVACFSREDGFRKIEDGDLREVRPHDVDGLVRAAIDENDLEWPRDNSASQ